MTGTSEPPRPLTGGRRRSVARLAAVQALYQIEMGGETSDRVVAEFVKHRLDQEVDGDSYGEADPLLFGELVRGVTERRADLDGMISAVLTPDWPLERLEVILRAILRAGTFELFARKDVPARVVISEYLDVGHAFFAGKEPGMVNGVLDRLARTLRPDEVGGSARGG